MSSDTRSYDIALVIPVLNEEVNVPLLYARLVEVLNQLGKSYQIVFVDDGSTDRTFEELTKLHKQNDRVHVIRFTRNFGKSAAYSAGFEHATGEVVITMDGDLQDDASDIPNIYAAIESGYDMAVGWKTEGKDRVVAGKSLPSFIFNRVTARLTKLKIHDMNCPFKGYRLCVAKAVAAQMHGELYRYQPLLAHRMGYTIKEVKVQNLPRMHGRTKYGFSRFLRGFLDLLTVLFLTRFTDRPLHLFGTIGLMASAFGALIIAVLYVHKFLTGIGIGQYQPLFMLSILLVIFGIQFFSIGLVSEMIAMKVKDPSGKFTVRQIIE
jgi:glycosyltransferase involved in cell wall biosynthesis